MQRSWLLCEMALNSISTLETLAIKFLIREKQLTSLCAIFYKHLKISWAENFRMGYP